jgi:hypothetical protein
MKTRSYLLIFTLILFAGCNQKAQKAITQGEALMQVWESGNIEDLPGIMTDDAEYEAVQQLYTFKGLDEIGGYVKHVSSFAKDLKIEVLSIKPSAKFAVIEWIMSGIQDRPIPGRINKATNESFTLRGTTIIEMEKGMITKATDYMDVLGFVLQLGARVELPGGTLLGGMKTP